MTSQKDLFQNEIHEWIKNSLNNSSKYKYVKTFYGENISKINDVQLNKVESKNYFDFQCDLSVLVEDRSSNFHIILINRYTNAVGLTNIGEMLTYCRLVKPLFAFIISLVGHSSDINKIVSNEDNAKNIFEYDDHNQIFLLRLENSNPILDSILPVYARNRFQQIF